MRKRKSEEEKLEKDRAYHRKYYQEHREKFKERSRKWREKNPEKVKAYSNKYYHEITIPMRKKNMEQRENNSGELPLKRAMGYVRSALQYPENREPLLQWMYRELLVEQGKAE